MKRVSKHLCNFHVLHVVRDEWNTACTSQYCTETRYYTHYTLDSNHRHKYMVYHSTVSYHPIYVVGVSLSAYITIVNNHSDTQTVVWNVFVLVTCLNLILYWLHIKHSIVSPSIPPSRNSALQMNLIHCAVVHVVPHLQHYKNVYSLWCHLIMTGLCSHDLGHNLNWLVWW